MKKFNFKALLALLLVLAISFSLFACNAKITDPDYSLAIEGLGEPTSISKAQIVALKQTKVKGIYPSDKIQNNDNKHSATGAKLSDVLGHFGKTLNDVQTLRAYSKDGASIVMKEDEFNPEKGGTEILIAYVYDKVNLNEKEKSGSLRIVAPNNPNGYWLRELNRIVFNPDEQLVIPAVKQIYFMENFAKTSEWKVSDDESHFGIKISDLSPVMSVPENGNLYVRGYDLVNSVFKMREIYILKAAADTAMLTFTGTEDGSAMTDLDPIVFEGPNCDKMMKMKKTMYVATNDVAVVSLDMVFKVLDTDANNEILLKDALTLLNCITSVVANGEDKIQDKDTAKIIFKENKYMISQDNVETDLVSLVPFVDPTATIAPFELNVIYQGNTVKINNATVEGLILEDLYIDAGKNKYNLKALKLSDMIAKLNIDLGSYTEILFTASDGFSYTDIENAYDNTYIAFYSKKVDETTYEPCLQRFRKGSQNSGKETLKNVATIEFK